jgi:hypothetical protein
MTKLEGTRLTLENRYGTHSSLVYDQDMNIYDIWESLIRPVLLSAGYHPNTVDSLETCEECNRRREESVAPID